MKDICLTISELRRITQKFYLESGKDFRRYAISSLKYRVERIMKAYNAKSADELLSFMKGNRVFYENFIYDIQVPVTEMFRDPEMWAALVKQIFPKLAKKKSIQILLPACSTGEELYSLLLMLKHANLLEKSKITVSVLSKKNEQLIREASYSLKKRDQTEKNIELLPEEFDRDNLILLQNDTFRPNVELLNNVVFTYDDISKTDYYGKFDLILFRNHLIYYNDQLHKETMRQLYDALVKGGFLILGYGEQTGTLYKRRLKEVVKGERIYKKNTF